MLIDMTEKCVNVHMAGSYITTHSIYFLLFLRCLFVNFFFVLSPCRLCLLLSVANSHVGCRARIVHCDDAYSYEDNFIYLYSHYDLSMRWHNKGFNEFNSYVPFWLCKSIIIRCNAILLWNVSMKFHRLCIYLKLRLIACVKLNFSVYLSYWYSLCVCINSDLSSYRFFFSLYLQSV